MPEFVTVMRGYDRIQVDDYVNDLLAWVEDANERARCAEQALRRRDEELVTRQSSDAHAQPGALAALIVADAEEEAARIRAIAEESAAALRQQAVADVEQLRTARAVILADLRRMQRAVANAIGVEDDPSIIDLRERAGASA